MTEKAAHSASKDTTSPIPFVDLVLQYERRQPFLDDRMAAVLEQGRFTIGPEVTELETALAARAGAAQDKLPRL